MRLKTVVVRLPKASLSHKYTKKGVEYGKFRRTTTTNISFGLSIILVVRLRPYGEIG